MSVPQIDRLLGMEVYATKTGGVGGTIKRLVEDFVVEEVLVDGSKASVQGQAPAKVLGSTKTRQRYLLCILVKRNWDTFIAVKNLAKEFGIDQNRIQFAGIKDAKAQTAQYITIENVEPQAIANAGIKDLSVQSVGYVREPLSLFYLLGNDFTITIRNPIETDAIKKQITETIQQLSAVGGVPNFYGHQRFGTTRPITHLVGKALVQGDFREAAVLFLANPSSHEHPASRQARQQLRETGDFKTASEYFPRQLRFERQMLAHLSECSDDFVGAFQRLPPKLLALFVQAHQSYLFNRFLSERIRAGLPLNRAVVGDFVVGVERSGLPLTAVSKIVTDQNLEEINGQVAAGRMRVALPIVGAKQKLSHGAMGQLEMEVLKQEDAEGKVEVNALSKLGGKGGLRAVLTPLREFKLQVINKDENSKGLAIVSFMLLRGSYATIVLRELMKPQSPVEAGF